MRYFIVYLLPSNISIFVGAYIKEFVHGDLGRTTPSVGELLNAPVHDSVSDKTPVSCAAVPHEPLTRRFGRRGVVYPRPVKDPAIEADILQVRQVKAGYCMHSSGGSS